MIFILCIFTYTILQGHSDVFEGHCTKDRKRRYSTNKTTLNALVSFRESREYQWLASAMIRSHNWIFSMRTLFWAVQFFLGKFSTLRSPMHKNWYSQNISPTQNHFAYSTYAQKFQKTATSNLSDTPLWEYAWSLSVLYYFMLHLTQCSCWLCRSIVATGVKGRNRIRNMLKSRNLHECSLLNSFLVKSQ